MKPKLFQTNPDVGLGVMDFTFIPQSRSFVAAAAAAAAASSTDLKGA